MTHPTVYVTSASAETARRNMRNHAWARKAADKITSEARWWLDKSDDWILRQVPGPGACYAYGFAGCPNCGGSLGIWNAARASFDDPGHVLCANGHRLPDNDHFDTGTGYLARDGRIHYFVGSYNAWVMERLTFGGLNSLANAYFLTGDEAYARKAALLLDAIADVYPTCDVGSWDYPEQKNTGRFNRPQYQVARVLIYYVGDYDMIYNSPALDEPSIRKGMSRRRNIEENLLRNGGQYCYDMSLKGALHNGEADYLRGVLAVGVCLGIDDWVRWPVNGPFGILSMFENNLGRDGTYYESASGYSDHARRLYMTFAEPLLNCRRPVFPNGLNLYEHPKFAAFMRLHNLKTNVTGVPAVYGDWAPLAKQFEQTDEPFDRSDYMCIEHLYAAATGVAERRDLAALLLWMADGDIEKARAGALDTTWLLYHALDVPASGSPTKPPLARRIVETDFLGQKGLAFLRTGKAPDAQAVMLRFGPTLNHGHFDDLSLSYYAKGYNMTYHLGYVLGSAHVYVGLAKQTAGHCTVVVNERSQGEDRKVGTGGSLTLFADLPTAKVAEASCPESYGAQSVDVYDRTVALIGDPQTTHTYLLDIFRVGGGTQHDYSFHGLGDSVQFAGLAPGPEEKGSVAGPDISWGDKILVDGDIEGYPGKFYWNAPPGNGYGFMVKPQRAKPAGAWSADWAIGTSGTRMRLNMPADAEQEVITAVGPGVTKMVPQARFVLARRKGNNLRSEFIAAVEPHDGSPRIERVERLGVTNAGKKVPAVAAMIHLKDGAADFIYSAGDAEPREAGGFTVAARFAHLRLRNAKPDALSMVGARSFQGKGIDVKAETDAGWHGTVAAVDAAAGILTTTTTLPADETLIGKVIRIMNPAYSRSTSYRIGHVEKQADGSRIVLEETCVLGKGVVDEQRGPRTIVSSVIHEYAKALWRADTKFFQGKLIDGASGAKTHVRSAITSDTVTLELEDPDVFAKGEVFYYHDVQPGDTFAIDNEVWVRDFRSE